MLKLLLAASNSMDSQCLPFSGWGKRKKSKTITVVLLGIDNAGKTTLMNTLKGDFGQKTTATFGFSRDVIQHGAHKLQIYDLGGGKTIRRIWRMYLAEVHGAVFVVDASDPNRLEQSKFVLHEVLEDPHMRGKPLLVLANKQDAPGALSPEQMTGALGLTDFGPDLSYAVMPCIAKTEVQQPPDSHISEGFDWVVAKVEKLWPKLSVRVAKEAEVARLEEERRTKERAQRAAAAREERLRLQAEEEAKANSPAAPSTSASPHANQQADTEMVDSPLPPSLATPAGTAASFGGSPYSNASASQAGTPAAASSSSPGSALQAASPAGNPGSRNAFGASPSTSPQVKSPPAVKTSAFTASPVITEPLESLAPRSKINDLVAEDMDCPSPSSPDDQATAVVMNVFRNTPGSARSGMGANRRQPMIKESYKSSLPGGIPD